MITREKHLMSLPLKKIKCLTLLMFTLMLIIATFHFMSTVKAEVKIISINPTSGHVGTNITFTANITTPNGGCRILFDEIELWSGNATENKVNVNITIPPSTVGNHTLMIIDVDSGENDTATFEVLTSYSLEITPLELPTQQRQEGDFAEIHVNITGGKSNEQYVANITVQAPNNASSTKLLDIFTSEFGSGNATIKYPENFANANTIYVGEYQVFFNETLATASFTIGLTNSTEYHRFQVVDIKAVYAPFENVNLTIAGKDLYYSVNLTADENGIIHYTDWAVLANASIGIYTLNITSIYGPTKNPADIQEFTVPGFDVNVTAINLAQEPVPEVTIQIFENEAFIVNATSDLPSVKLEIGNYTANAYFKETKVGEGWVNVTESSLSFNVTCNLTNLRVFVFTIVDGNEFYVPEVGLSLSPENLTLTPNLTTNITGIAIFHYLLPNINYTLNASRYDTNFNTTTLYGLLQDGNPVAWFNLTITCPTYTLQVNVTNPNANDQPISDALVKVQEVMGGLCYNETTNGNGTVIFTSPLGRYIVEVYVGGIKLNGTVVNLNESFINVPISCKFYGLNIAIQVVDYFGQPISNANVILSLNSLQWSNLTKSDGVADFLGIIGGNLQVTVYLPGQSEPYVTSSFNIDSSKTVQIKIERYTLMAGFLVEIGQLVTVIIIMVSVILILFLEIYRRRRLKPKKELK
jgi:hypothetical protein